MKIQNLYNRVLLKSRNFDIYNSYNIKDTLQNKIIILLIHFSFIFNKLKLVNSNNNQEIFDYIFAKIESDLREIGMGDMFINKKMKTIVNKFYSILVNFNNFYTKTEDEKIAILSPLLTLNSNKANNYHDITKYFNKFSKTIDLISADDIYCGRF